MKNPICSARPFPEMNMYGGSRSVQYYHTPCAYRYYFLSSPPRATAADPSISSAAPRTTVVTARFSVPHPPPIITRASAGAFPRFFRRARGIPRGPTDLNSCIRCFIYGRTYSQSRISIRRITHLPPTFRFIFVYVYSFGILNYDSGGVSDAPRDPPPAEKNVNSFSFFFFYQSRSLLRSVNIRHTTVVNK